MTDFNQSDLHNNLLHNEQQKISVKAAPLQILKAIFWSMLGVRQQKGYENDVAKISLKQAIIGGLIGGLIFIATMASMVMLAFKFLAP
jgi:Protein of unknown function (DUF2970)